jgi:hypothetical protein
VSLVQPKHTLRAQTGVVTEQSASLRQTTQVFVVVLQTGVARGQAAALPQLPVSSHVWVRVPSPVHCVVFGTQLPVQVPVVGEHT